MPERVTLDDLAPNPHALAFESPRTVRLHLDAGERVPPHSHPDHDVVVLVLTGRLDLTLDEEVHALAAGDAIRFDGERQVSPAAEEATRAVVVLAPR